MSTSVPSETRAITAKQLRRIRARRVSLRFGLGVGVPLLLAALYFGVYVTPRYESVSTFTIQSADGQPAAASVLVTLMSSAGGTARQDMFLAREYVSSRDMARHLVEEHGFVEHYSSDEIDGVSRLAPDASFEEVYAFYRDHIDVIFDTDTGVLALSVQAFDAASAHRLAEAVLAEVERKVNELSEHARQDRIALARAELERAETRLSNARTALRELQSERGAFNPVASAAATLEIRTRLEGELAIARADQSTRAATMPRGAPEVTAARRRVAALQRQIDELSGRLAGGDDQSGLNEQLAAFEPVMIEKEFAQRAYESALSSLELARVDASRQHRYLVRLAEPSRPDEPTHPRFWYSMLTVLVLAFAIVGIGALLIASIREHANV